MGTDIHFTVEKRINGVWVAQEQPKCPDDSLREKWGEDLSPFWGPGFYSSSRTEYHWFHDRSYFLFAILANVRNYGHEVRPISDPRDLPEDAALDSSWYGYHSQTWLSLKEVLDYNWDQQFSVVGTIPLKIEHAAFALGNISYESWGYGKHPKHRGGNPGSWSDAIGGPNIETIDEATADMFLGNPEMIREGISFYVRVHWFDTAKNRCARFLQMITDYVMPLGEVDDIRFVFGFDS